MHLIVISSYWPRPDHILQASFEVDQVRAFAGLGHQVNVLVQTSPWRPRAPYLDTSALNLDPERISVKQIIVPRLPESFSRNPAGALFNLRLAGLRMRFWLSRYEAYHGRVDAIIAHGERNLGLSAGIWNTGQKRPVALIIHGADHVIESWPDKALERKLGTTANSGLSKIILVGNRLRGYAERLGYDPMRIAVIPNGFDSPNISNEPLRGSQIPVRFVTVARLVSAKGIDDALLALAKFRRGHQALEWVFDILGDGPERARLEKLCNKLDLQNHVVFHGAVPHSKVIAQLQKSQIFVLPSWNEAFGLAYLEAMAMGCTVIGCFENGAADILTDGVDGRLVPPRDVERLADVLAELVTDEKQREALTTAAKKSVKRFSWPANARSVIEALSE